MNENSNNNETAAFGNALLCEVLAYLETTRQRHNYCEDTWYSCPKHEEGCANSGWGNECNCGADDFNKKLDEMIDKVKQHFA